MTGQLTQKKRLCLMLLMCSPAWGNTVFIGDSIAHGYRMASAGRGTTKIGASPGEVRQMVEQFKQGGDVVLSSGASNLCSDMGNISAAIDTAKSKFSNVLLLSAPHCSSGVNLRMARLCTGNCEFVIIKAGPDGVHPARYNSRKLIVNK
ncbi:hypothetical protein [Phytobacter sp. V91]|uniref:hypothetical protein n=1 Tax=Phytobacter sp. V91 TaxID=3369425 RepID=UPI003F62C925